MNSHILESDYNAFHDFQFYDFVFMFFAVNFFLDNILSGGDSGSFSMFVSTYGFEYVNLSWS